MFQVNRAQEGGGLYVYIIDAWCWTDNVSQWSKPKCEDVDHVIVTISNLTFTQTQILKMHGIISQLYMIKCIFE